MTTQNPAPPELTDQQIAELSPADREQYFHDRAAAGVNDDGMLGWFRRIQANVEAQGQADRASQDTIRDLSSGADVQFVEGLNPSDANYQGHEHAQMSQYVTQNLDADQVGQVSDAYHELHLAFKDFATQLKDAVSKSEHEWEGEAASDARNYFVSLQEWSDGNATNAKLASETIYQQAEAASTARNRMPEEIPFNWDSEMAKWGSNPLDLIGNINKSIETYKASNEAHSQAATVMAQYDSDLYTAASKQPVFAEPPKFGAGSGRYDVTPPQPGSNGTDASGFVGGSVGGGQGSVAGAAIPPGGGSAGGAAIPGGGGAGGGGGYTPSPIPAPGPRTPGVGTGSVPVGTRPSGYQPPNFGRSGTGGGGGGNSSLHGMGPMPMGMAGGGMGGAGGGSDYSSKLGRGGAGGFGPGGGAGAGVGSGPASGVAKPGGVGAAEAAGRGGGAGAMGAAAGRGGMAGGMGAGMGGGRGGKGGEDEEHQRPTYLLEGDPDEVFGSDQRTAPPVIGE